MKKQGSYIRLESMASKQKKLGPQAQALLDEVEGEVTKLQERSTLTEDEKRILKEAELIDQINEKAKKKKVVPVPFYVMYKEETIGLTAIGTGLTSLGYIWGPMAVAIAGGLISGITALICLIALGDRRDSDLEYRKKHYKERKGL